MDRMYPSDFNVSESNPNGCFIKIDELNDMIAYGVLKLDETKLKEYQRKSGKIMKKPQIELNMNFQKQMDASLNFTRESILKTVIYVEIVELGLME